jgi:hypothetical protein
VVNHGQTHDAPKLRRAAYHPSGQVDIPDADTSRALGHSQDIVAFAQLLFHRPANADVAKTRPDPFRRRIDDDFGRPVRIVDRPGATVEEPPGGGIRVAND